MWVKSQLPCNYLRTLAKTLALGTVTLAPVAVAVGNTVEILAVSALLLGRGDVGLRLLDELDEVRNGVRRRGFVLGGLSHEQSLTWRKGCVNSDPILSLEDFLHVQ